MQFCELLAGSIIGLLASNPRQGTIEKIRASIRLQNQALAAKDAALYNQAHLDMRSAIGEHKKILKAIEAPDVPAAQAAFREHLQELVSRAG